jgi:nitrogen regulatory protein PII
MEAMKKLEIVVDSIELRRVTKALDGLGVSGYTIIREVEGKGGRGVQSGDELSDVFRNSYVMTVCEPERVDAIVATIRPMLKKRGGLCVVSDCAWVKH